MKLNVPDTRQNLLAERLANGVQIVAPKVAAEFGVSLDTIRRDILALEAAGKAQRVRGGAVPVAQPADPLHLRLALKNQPNPVLVKAAVEQIASTPTVLVDGGTTTLSIIMQLPKLENRLIITPSPWVAIACQESGVNVFMIGGSLSVQGGIATGGVTLAKIAEISADVALLGACGLDVEFGLSSDDYAESQAKAAMSAAADRTIVVTDAPKLGRRARHHTLPLVRIDQIVTDAPLSESDLFRSGEIMITTV
ncbi:MAG: DeoR/GlpR family DNA-binding transcription regulator [Roseobacter sp.]